MEPTKRASPRSLGRAASGPPLTWCGTSVGAINAAWVAAHADKGDLEAVEKPRGAPCRRVPPVNQRAARALGSAHARGRSASVFPPLRDAGLVVASPRTIARDRRGELWHATNVVTNRELLVTQSPPSLRNTEGHPRTDAPTTARPRTAFSRLSRCTRHCRVGDSPVIGSRTCPLRLDAGCLWPVASHERRRLRGGRVRRPEAAGWW